MLPPDADNAETHIVDIVGEHKHQVSSSVSL